MAVIVGFDVIGPAKYSGSKPSEVQVQLLLAKRLLAIQASSDGYLYTLTMAASSIATSSFMVTPPA